MPFNSKGRWFNDPESADRASLAPAVYSATPTLAAFAVEDAETLMALLKTHALLETALTGNNNDLDFIARVSGSGGASVTVTLVDPGGVTSSLAVTAVGGSTTASNFIGHQAVPTSGTYAIGDYVVKPDNTVFVCSVASVAGNGGTWVAVTDVVVSLARASSAITSTSAQVMAAIQAHIAANALVAVNHKSGNTGVGIVTALTKTSLADWASTSTLDLSLQTSVAGAAYYSVGTFPQATGIGAAAGHAFAPLGDTAKWIATVAGTAHIVAFSIDAQDHTLTG